MSANTVSVTRPGKYGNPYPTATAFRNILKLFIDKKEVDMTFDPERRERMKWIAENIHMLCGKNLACFCALDQDCHADVLLEFANQPITLKPPARVVELSNDQCVMPRTLTAENGAKGLLIGEFFETVEVPIERECDCGGCQVCDNYNDNFIAGEDTDTVKVPVSWTTIKSIYKMAVEHLAQ